MYVQNSDYDDDDVAKRWLLTIYVYDGGDGGVMMMKH